VECSTARTYCLLFAFNLIFFYRERQDLLLGLAKTVANNTAALVLKAKNVASKCEDQYTQNRVRTRADSGYFKYVCVL
jgi:hypothetical protein